MTDPLLIGAGVMLVGVAAGGILGWVGGYAEGKLEVLETPEVTMPEEIGRAEIHFTDDTDPQPADGVVILDNGYVRAINKHNYDVSFYPPHKIDGVHTHTTDEQDAIINHDGATL